MWIQMVRLYTIYVLSIEFQMRGSPHVHSLIWMAGLPKLSHDTKEAYMIFIDKHVQALPDKDKDADFLEMMKNIKHMTTVKRAGSI